MKKLLLTALFVLPLAANAVDWIDLGKSKDKQLQTFLDYDSVKRQELTVYGGGSSFRSSKEKSKYISAILQLTYINNHPLRKKGMYYSKEQWFISCEDGTYFTKARIDYGFKDEVVDSWQSSKSTLTEADFSYAFPETMGGSAIEQACNSLLLKELDSTENYEEFRRKYIFDD